jgi:hypothetical protein
LLLSTITYIFRFKLLYIGNNSEFDTITNKFYFYNNRFNHISKFIQIHILRDATLHSLFYLETAVHVPGGTTTYHQERKQLYLQHLVFITPLLLPAVIAMMGDGTTRNM